MQVTNLKFKGWNCYLDVATYQHGGRIALQLFEHGTGDYIAVATVNMPDHQLTPSEVAIKNYSENEGVLDLLIEAGVLREPHRYVRNGFVTLPVCHLNFVSKSEDGTYNVDIPTVDEKDKQLLEGEMDGPSLIEEDVWDYGDDIELPW